MKFLDLFGDHDVNITMAIATAHTIFNVVNVIMFTPFIGYLADFLCKVVKDDGKVNDRVTKIDELMLKTSGVVVEQTKVEVGNMGKMIQIMFDEVKSMYDNPKLITDNKVKELRKMEDDLDLYQKEITDANFVILNNKDINDSLRKDIRNNLIVSDEYETVSDYLMRITNSLKKLQDNVIFLTEQEMNVVKTLHEKTNEFFRNIDRGYQEKNPILIKECVVNAKEVTTLWILE